MNRSEICPLCGFWVDVDDECYLVSNEELNIYLYFHVGCYEENRMAKKTKTPLDFSDAKKLN